MHYLVKMRAKLRQVSDDAQKTASDRSVLGLRL